MKPHIQEDSSTPSFPSVLSSSLSSSQSESLTRPARPPSPTGFGAWVAVPESESVFSRGNAQFDEDDNNGSKNEEDTNENDNSDDSDSDREDTGQKNVFDHQYSKASSITDIVNDIANNNNKVQFKRKAGTPTPSSELNSVNQKQSNKKFRKKLNQEDR
jgi:hypothetical protein